VVSMAGKGFGEITFLIILECHSSFNEKPKKNPCLHFVADKDFDKIKV
jgi:hypothetical protein